MSNNIKIKQNRRDRILSGKYPIMLDDQIFKNVFRHKKMAKYLLDALSDYLHLNLKYGSIRCEPQKLDMADSVLKQDYYRDIVITTDTGDILLFESYTTFGLKQYRKSEAYLDRVSSSRFEKNNKDNFTEDNKVICFNFVPRKGTKKNFIKKYGIVDLETLKEPYKKVNDYKQMYIVFVDSYETEVYNKDERLLEILDFMNRKSMSELENLAKGGNWFMEQALKFVDAYLANDANKGYGSQYDLDVEIAREEGEKVGRAAGRKAGIKAGRKAGIKANQIATAKNLISLGSNNDFIAKATGLKENIIEKLRIN